MSAAEKLKALDARDDWPYPDGPDDPQTPLLNALPQIVAVVEAADMLANWHQPRIVPTKQVPDITAAFHATQAALAALDEALA